jgi:hypothetical protein
MSLAPRSLHYREPVYGGAYPTGPFGAKNGAVEKGGTPSFFLLH